LTISRQIRFLQICVLLVTLLMLRGTSAAHAGETPGTGAASDVDVNELATAGYAQKAEIVGKLVSLHRRGTREFLQAMLDGLVYTRQTDSKVFIVAAAADAPDSQFLLTDPVSGKSAGTQAQDGFDRIGINNSLRKVLRGAIARFDLESPDVGVRKAAVVQMLHSLDESAVTLLGERLRVERDSSVKEEIETGIALSELDGDKTPQRLAAIDRLSKSLNPDVYNRLASLTDPSSEADAGVRNAAGAALRHIDSWRKLYGALETLFFGLSLGSVLVLSAIGLAITFGVMGVINMAHGELMMLGAYTTYVMQLLMPNHIGTSIVVAIPAAFLVCGAVGVLIERGIVRFLYGRPLETLLATFGLSLILQQVVRDVFTANNRPVEAPSWLTGSLQINAALSITYNRLATVLFMMLVFGILLLVLNRTRLGLQVRAVAQNRSMAKAMGVPTEWVDALTFGLGSGVAGVAGVALSQLTNVGPNLGQSYIVDSFMVVVFGGVGNLWGTLIGGMSLGVVNKILEPFAGAVLGKIIVLVCLILFIQWKPRGLFPQKGRAAEV
jgi:urea transport system permease protein